MTSAGTGAQRFQTGPLWTREASITSSGETKAAPSEVGEPAAPANITTGYNSGKLARVHRLS